MARRVTRQDGVAPPEVTDEELYEALAQAEQEGVGTAAEGSAREAYEETRKARVEAEPTFDQLPVIKHIRELWESKGVLADDPMFLSVEMMGLFDARLRSSIKKLVVLGDKTEMFQMAMLDEMKSSMRELDKLSATGRDIVESARLCNEGMIALQKTNSELLAQLPDYYKTISESVKYLGELGRFQILFNWLTPGVCIAIGLLLGKFLLK